MTLFLSITFGVIVAGFAVTKLVTVVVRKNKEKQRGFHRELLNHAEQRLGRFHTSPKSTSVLL